VERRPDCARRRSQPPVAARARRRALRRNLVLRLRDGATRYVRAVKVALVTGANTGIGLAIAQRLLRDGYAVAYATAGDAEHHRAPYEELRTQYGERILWVMGDLADPSVPERLVAETAEKLGPVDVLVNNAGLSTAKPFLDLTVDDFDRTFDIDVRASFLLSQSVVRRMEAGGSIVNITSVHEHIPRPNFAVYAAAKAALGMLTHALALELADRNIRVNSVAPGVIATPRNRSDAKELDPEVPLGRPGRPDEVAALVAWLCTDEAAYATGQSYILDGGMTQQVVKLPAGE
jgi:NAD(P)-dependent dehydrogenase (short-subunit alcohol dehydrogenase family)